MKADKKNRFTDEMCGETGIGAGQQGPGLSAVFTGNIAST